MPQTLLAIDDLSLPLRKNVCLYLTRPTVRPEPVLAPSPFESNAPDNLAAFFYGTVLHDGGKFRMWYAAVHWGQNPDWPPRKMQQVAKPPSWLKDDAKVHSGPLCYAESDDGILWTKPALGQVLFKGSRDNNALDLPHTLVCGAAVIRDEADPDPARRYKMVYEFWPDQSEPPITEYGSLPTIACAVSPDGLQWTVTAIPFVDQFVEHCSFIRHGGRYIVHSQVFLGESWSAAYFDGGKGGRAGVAHASGDFDHWPDFWEPSFALPEPRDRSLRGTGKPYDQVHLGVGAASFGNVCVGVYGLWHDQPVFGDISGDLGLVVSNDGIRFREPAPGHVFIHRDESPVTPAAGQSFPTILCQGNGIMTVGDETRIYHGRWRNAADGHWRHYWGEVALATLPRDRWGAFGLNPDADEGMVCTAPITLPARGCVVRANADGVAGLTVGLLDEQFRAIPGFTDGRVIGSDGLACPVRWEGRSLADLGDRPVRVLVKLRRAAQSVVLGQSAACEPRLYALYVDDAP